MDKQEQQLAIAQACGLARLAPIQRRTRSGKRSSDGVVLWYLEEAHGGAEIWSKVPDYLNDLNAAHEMEKVLTDEQRVKFCSELYAIAGATQNIWGYDLIHATAIQRAEAFLRAIGKWKG